MCLCVLLTQRGVVEGEVPQVSGVLRQGEQAPGVTVPHQAASGAVLQHAVLDDLETQAGKQITRCSTNKTPRVYTSHPKWKVRHGGELQLSSHHSTMSIFL